MTTSDQQAGSAVAPENHIGPAPDREEILRVMHLYTDGVGAHDPAVFLEAFNPTARISYLTPDGELHEGPVDAMFDDWANWPTSVTCRVISLVQAGDLATVVFGWDSHSGPADSWLDAHSLLRVGGTWKIMNYTAEHASRAAWAAPTAAGSSTGVARD
jgi:Putative lumazine-binding